MYFLIFVFFMSFKSLHSFKDVKSIYSNKYSYYKLNNINQNNNDYDKYIIKPSNNFNNIKNSSFYLPGFFEVFPEFKIDFSKHDFKFKKCVKDTDCEKPEMCCDSPFKKNEKFCCKGSLVGKRTPAYAF